MDLFKLLYLFQKKSSSFHRDVDLSLQGPGIFETKDTEIMESIANQLFFARKFDGDPENPARLFALNQVSGQYYEFLRKNFISEEMLRFVGSCLNLV